MAGETTANRGGNVNSSGAEMGKGVRGSGQAIDGVLHSGKLAVDESSTQQDNNNNI